MMKRASLLLGLAGALCVAGPASAAEEATALREVEFSFDGPFGTFDRAAAQRGFQVARAVCASCHGMQYLAFRELGALGYSEEMIAAIAAEFEVEDGPDEFGDMFRRPAKPSDRMPSPFPNEEAARAANGGALPPDLSVIVKARAGGAPYIYSLLTGYDEPPAGEELRPGLYWNSYFAGHRIAMPQPLYDDLVEYQDGTPATVEQMAHDVTTFLAWLAEPSMEHRKSMGLSFLLFMAVFTVLLYLSYKRVWRPVKEGRDLQS